MCNVDTCTVHTHLHVHVQVRGHVRGRERDGSRLEMVRTQHIGVMFSSDWSFLVQTDPDLITRGLNLAKVTQRPEEKKSGG